MCLPVITTSLQFLPDRDLANISKQEQPVTRFLRFGVTSIAGIGNGVRTGGGVVWRRGEEKGTPAHHLGLRALGVVTR